MDEDELKCQYWKDRKFHDDYISMDNPVTGFIAYLIYRVNTKEEDIIAECLSNCRIEGENIIYNPNYNR